MREEVSKLRDEAGHRKVRAVLRQDGELCELLLEVASGNRKYWDLTAWRKLLRRLRACELTVEDWLKERDLL